MIPFSKAVYILYIHKNIGMKKVNVHMHKITWKKLNNNHKPYFDPFG